MYHQHFGLRHEPFAATHDPSNYVPLDSRESVLRRLRYGLERGRGPVLIFGRAGLGKTLVARVLAERLSQPWTLLNYPALDSESWLGWVLDDLIHASARRNLAVAVPWSSSQEHPARRLAHWLRGMVTQGVRPVLIVDEAQLIVDPQLIETIRLILNFDEDGAPILQVILVGQPEVILGLGEALLDRITASAVLEPFGLEDSQAYLESRLISAGAERPLLDPDAIAILHEASEGSPRRLNAVADLSLLIAADRGRDRVDRDSVETAVREVSEMPLNLS